jgi:DNA-binding FadR family transcriptional regulator
MMSDNHGADQPCPPLARRASLVDEVVGKLRKLIERNGLSPGARLPTEMELTSRMNVSRTVLREAVRKLGAVGLIQVRHGHGMFVGDASAVAGGVELLRSSLALAPRDLTQLLDLRAALECYAVRQAAERARSEEAAQLESLCRQMDRKGLPYEKTVQLDFAFHQKLFEIAGNPLMLGVVGLLRDLILEGMLQTTPDPRDRTVSQELHHAIAAAVQVADPDAAEAAMRKHMRITRERLARTAGRSLEAGGEGGVTSDK